ncbi:unnamed protein product [Clonostachys solani]|uniref:SnoaL-like domain-containing protein n=1 Tax=Clonostachys solani TaxID=160281 RepID=A0A9N9ZLY7_9HYPO|nr:unnamed protein product [Clonostachys solani]
MASADSLSNSSSLADWFDGLSHNIFFQPDDALASKTFEERVADDAVIRINHDQLGKAKYWEIIKAARAASHMAAQSSKEIHTWNAPDGLGGGCVAQLGYFTTTKKEGGTEAVGSSLTLTNVHVRDGKRVLVELTEVMNG